MFRFVVDVESVTFNVCYACSINKCDSLRERTLITVVFPDLHEQLCILLKESISLDILVNSCVVV